VLLDRAGLPLLFDLDPPGYSPPEDATWVDARWTLDVAGLAGLAARLCDVDSERLREFFASVGDHTELGAEGLRTALEDFLDELEDAAPRRAAAYTDVGLYRDLDEDAWAWAGVAPGVRVYAVADGMGGHDGGEVASALASSVVCAEAKATMGDARGDLDVLEDRLANAVLAAHRRIAARAEDKGVQMGTTLCAVCVVDGEGALLANVGDSRCYRLRGDELEQLSEDDSLVWMMVERGKLTKEEARNHPKSNILLKHLGGDDFDVEVARVDVRAGDRLLLCTDGLWGPVPDKRIGAVLRAMPDPREAALALVRAAHRGGGGDNVTVLVVDVP
jgi:protein phosphatase